MKRLIIGVFAIAALLFGFVSCSGDLHDVDKRAPLVSGYELQAWERKDATPDATRGWVRSLDIVNLEVDHFDEAEIATYYKPVKWDIAGETTILVDFAVEKDNWKYRYEIDGSEELKKDEWYAFSEGMKAEKSKGRSYIPATAGGSIEVTFKDSDGTLYVKYSSEEAKIVKVAYESKIYKANLSDPNVYTATVTAANDGDLEVSVDYNNVLLKPVKITDAVKGKDYVVTVDATKGNNEVTVSIELDLPKVYIVGDIAKDNKFVEFDRVTEKSYRSYVFTYDSATMNAWGSTAGTLQFQLSSKANDWQKVFFKNGDNFNDVNGAWLLADASSKDNCKLTDLEDGVTYMILVDVSADADDASKWKAKTIKSPLYIVGDYSGVEESLLPNGFFPIMNVTENEDKSIEYTYTFKYDSATMNAWNGSGFKVAPVTDWSNAYGGDCDDTEKHNAIPIKITFADTWTSLYSKAEIRDRYKGAGDVGNINFDVAQGSTYSIVTKLAADGKVSIKVKTDAKVDTRTEADVSAVNAKTVVQEGAKLKFEGSNCKDFNGLEIAFGGKTTVSKDVTIRDATAFADWGTDPKSVFAAWFKFYAGTDDGSLKPANAQFGAGPTTLGSEIAIGKDTSKNFVVTNLTSVTVGDIYTLTITTTDTEATLKLEKK